MCVLLFFSISGVGGFRVKIQTAEITLELQLKKKYS
jgi:hypothetical protein